MNLDPAVEPLPRTSIVVGVGTFKRNEPLAVLLDSVIVAADRARGLAAVGVIIVDDNPDGRADVVADRYSGAFELGVTYRRVGKGNISLVRNCAIETGVPLAEWVALTDDDCEVTPDWLVELLAKRAPDVDVVTGPCEVRVPPGSPAWLTEQPFLSAGEMHAPDGSDVEVGCTGNSLLRSSWLVEHAEHRFEERLGVVGGEDMVFFRSAHRKGMHIRFAANAVVYCNEPPARTTFKYRLRVAFWLGNTMAVTASELGSASRLRVLLRSVKAFARAGSRPIRRLVARQSPQWRFCVADLTQAAGTMAGALGFRHRHH